MINDIYVFQPVPTAFCTPGKHVGRAGDDDTLLTFSTQQPLATM